MAAQNYRKKLLSILENDPDVFKILTSGKTINEKRRAIRTLLSVRDDQIFDGKTKIPHLEWIIAREAIVVFRNILAVRSENLAGFSFLKYINDSIMENGKPSPPPSPAFLSEVEHLIKGISGNAGIYPEKIPKFAVESGQKAARLRSVELSRMASVALRDMDRFASGLDLDVVRRRSENKMRVMNFFGATDVEWEDWKWHARNIVRDADKLASLIQLSPEERKAVELSRKLKIPFGITPYYITLMDIEAGSPRDTAVRAQVIPSLHYIEKLHEMKSGSECSMDFMLERDTSPIEGITRRYPMICILKPVMTCPQICVYCQRNWEIEDVYSRSAFLSKDKLDRAIKWIADTPEIKEVLVTGGDPFLLSNLQLENLLFRLSKISHVERIRIGTRTPVTLPQRITDSLVRDINHFHNPGKREVIIITHFEHPYEITPEAMEAVQKFKRYGIEVYNQLVFTFYNSRRFEAASLRHKLRMIGVTPYYTFNTKGKEETDEYRVPIARLLQEQKEEARLLPGSVRTDEIVFNVPKLGKNYLRAAQHHSLLSIHPDGCRMYEFHPWEKMLTLVDTYLYKDVSIYDYVQRLKKSGEDVSKYKSIWYYY